MTTARVQSLVCGCEFDRSTRQWKFCEEHGQAELVVAWPLCKCGRDFISEGNLHRHIVKENRKFDPSWVGGTDKEMPHGRVDQGVPKK